MGVVVLFFFSVASVHLAAFYQLKTTYQTSHETSRVC